MQIRIVLSIKLYFKIWRITSEGKIRNHIIPIITIACKLFYCEMFLNNMKDKMQRYMFCTRHSLVNLIIFSYVCSWGSLFYYSHFIDEALKVHISVILSYHRASYQRSNFWFFHNEKARSKISIKFVLSK